MTGITSLPATPDSVPDSPVPARSARLSLSQAVKRMRDGALLVRVHERHVIWILGDLRITDRLAADLVAHPQIRPTGDALPLGLPGGFSQTFAYVQQ